MAKLYFTYSAMNAGKSTLLLQASYNYAERGMKTLLYTAALDNRTRVGEISSRIGLKAEAFIFQTDTDLFAHISEQTAQERPDCIFFDEAQFLSEEQVWQLGRVADELHVPIMCYGLRTDFQGELFPGSQRLLAIADELREARTICWCGRKASMVVRIDGDGKVIEEGEQVVIGGEESYISLCRKHWSAKDLGGKDRSNPQGNLHLEDLLDPQGDLELEKN
ncbi:thymidine kinase [Cohaesibacter gelatinilyticus]|uniref:Thymidine kinase n=1 Tax=Cohaesibacter gelatinilyticus TaxID=372072 RepID=A0A285PP07_9HYPH|nr:thymidine kinase [Cohaesibacter gelatinilyticus]SNZ21661.1 thymidine kinase [Cohaesibacter gelatinilyticus]